MIEHLDRIQNLGFTIEILWNQQISISLEGPDSSTSTFAPTSQPFGVRILFCYYNYRPDFSFEEMVESSCDFFYMWYNKNLKKLKEFENLNTDETYSVLCDSILGDISKQVYRDISLDQIFD